MPVVAFSDTIDGVSSYVVGAHPDDMNGMEVRVQYSDNSWSDWSIWNSNSASHTDGWDLTYTPTTSNTGGSITNSFLDWKFTTGNNSIKQLEINAFANKRVMFDIYFSHGQFTYDSTPGSSQGFWAPNIDLANLNQLQLSTGISASSGSFFTGTGGAKSYGVGFEWTFSEKIFYDDGVGGFDDKEYGDLYEFLTINFDYDPSLTAQGTTRPFSGEFLFGVDTDLVAGAEIPEPGTIILFGFGLLTVSAISRKKR